MKHLLIAVGTGLVVFTISAFAAHFLFPDVGAFAQQVGMKLILAGLSAYVALVVFRLSLRDFALKQNETGKRTWKYAGFAFLLGALATVLVLLLKLPPIPLLKEMSFLEYIIAVWIFSSICEEIFARGMVQGIVKKYHEADQKGNRSPSLEVYAGAIVFSLIHASIYITGGGLYTTILIMICTLVLGILCGFARAKGNLSSAIVVHLAFNIGGLFGGIVATIVSKAI